MITNERDWDDFIHALLWFVPLLAVGCFVLGFAVGRWL